MKKATSWGLASLLTLTLIPGQQVHGIKGAGQKTLDLRRSPRIERNEDAKRREQFLKNKFQGAIRPLEREDAINEAQREQQEPDFQEGRRDELSNDPIREKLLREPRGRDFEENKNKLLAKMKEIIGYKDCFPKKFNNLFPLIDRLLKSTVRADLKDDGDLDESVLEGLQEGVWCLGEIIAEKTSLGVFLNLEEAINSLQYVEKDAEDRDIGYFMKALGDLMEELEAIKKKQFPEILDEIIQRLEKTNLKNVQDLFRLFKNTYPQDLDGDWVSTAIRCLNRFIEIKKDNPAKKFNILGYLIERLANIARLNPCLIPIMTKFIAEIEPLRKEQLLATAKKVRKILKKAPPLQELIEPFQRFADAMQDTENFSKNEMKYLSLAIFCLGRLATPGARMALVELDKAILYLREIVSSSLEGSPLHASAVSLKKAVEEVRGREDPNLTEGSSDRD